MSNYWQDVRKHQVNSSTSKSAYAFPKSNRFRSNSKILCDSFYNVPSSIGKSQKSGIGLGKKVQIGRKSQSPSPNKYNISSDFDLTKKNVSMGKFSLGRQKIKYNGIFVKNQNPPPGNYDVRSSMIMKNGISMHPKLPTLKKSYQLNPGPGQYSQHNTTFNSTGRYIVSTIINTPGIKIKNSKQFDANKYKKVPGPGSYNLQKQNLNQTGRFFNSKFQNSRSRSFSRSPKGKQTITSRKNLPGPGAYNFFSDFGAKLRK